MSSSSRTTDPTQEAATPTTITASDGAVVVSCSGLVFVEGGETVTLSNITASEFVTHDVTFTLPATVAASNGAVLVSSSGIVFVEGLETPVTTETVTLSTIQEDTFITHDVTFILTGAGGITGGIEPTTAYCSPATVSEPRGPSQ